MKTLMCSVAAVAAAGAMSVSAASTVYSLRGCDNGYSKLVDKANGAGNFYWQDGEAFPDSDADYVSIHLIRTPPQSGHDVFGGHSLTLRSGGFCNKTPGDSSMTFNGDGLFLEGGYISDWAGGSYTIKGASVTVTADAGNPFGFYPADNIKPWDAEHKIFTIAAPFKGSATVGIYLSGAANPTDGENSFRLALSGNCSDYQGKVDLRKGGALYYLSDGGSFPAAIAVRAGGKFIVSNAVSLASLDLAKGGKVTLADATEIGTLSYFGGDLELLANPDTGAVAALSLTVLERADAKPLRIALQWNRQVPLSQSTAVFTGFLKVPVSLGLDDADIRVHAERANAFALPSFAVSHVDENEVRTFTATAVAYRTQIENDGGNHSCLSEKSSCFPDEDAKHWDVEGYPQPGYDYYTPFDKTVRTTYSEGEVSDFQGRSLTLAGCMTMKGGLKIADLRLACDPLRTVAIIPAGAERVHIYGGTISVLSAVDLAGTARNASTSRHVYLDSSLVGGGSLRVAVHSAETNYREIFAYLTGDNTEFDGDLTVTSYLSAEKLEQNPLATAVLVVTNVVNLGSTNLLERKLAAIKLSNNGLLRVDDDVIVTDPNRGITVDGVARFNVAAGKKLSLAGPLSLAGTLTKSGEGALVLGGEALVSSAGRLAVDEGILKVLSTNAVDGAVVAFASGASLRLTWPTTDSDLAKFGLYNVAVDDPFDLSKNEGMLDVGFDLSPEIRSAQGQVVIPICTVSSAAPSLVGKIRFDADGSLTPVGLRTKVLLPGTITYFAVIRESGFMLLLR